MLKYLVMGIKELLKKTCKTCGVSISYHLKYCEKHGTFKPYVKTQVPKPKRYTIEDYADVLKVFKIHTSCARINLIEKEYIIVDENGLVVGYK